MRHRARFTAALAAIITAAVAAAPAFAAPSRGGEDPVARIAPATPGPGAGAKTKRAAYGRYCGAAGRRGRHAVGVRMCIHALARLAAGQAATPRAACRALKRSARPGSRSEHRRCIMAARALMDDIDQATELDDERAEEADEAAAAAVAGIFSVLGGPGLSATPANGVPDGDGADSAGLVGADDPIDADDPEDPRDPGEPDEPDDPAV